MIVSTTGTVTSWNDCIHHWDSYKLEWLYPPLGQLQAGMIVSTTGTVTSWNDCIHHWDSYKLEWLYPPLGQLQVVMIAALKDCNSR